jgi:nucleoside-diphosphate-sugar epimerase
VTGSDTRLGSALLTRLAGRSDVPRVVAVDLAVDLAVDGGAVVLDTAALSELGTVVHLAVSYDPTAEPTARRRRTVTGTAALLAAARAAGVARVVLVSSTDVHAAPAAGAPLPLPEDLPLRAAPDSALTGDLLELERLAARAAADGLEVVLLRAATLVGGSMGAAYDGAVLQTLDGPRLLAVRGVEPVWQRCHTDDLLSALELAATGGLSGTAAVASSGWLTQREVEQLSGRSRLELPAAVALATAERLHRAHLTPGSSAELDRLLHPVAVQTRRLAEAGWLPAWTAEAALQAHLDAQAPGGRAGARTRSAAGATVALVGTAALVRRARRRRGR